MNRWMSGFITGAMLVLPFALFILLIQSTQPGKPSRSIPQDWLGVPVSTQIAPVGTSLAPLQTGIPPVPSTAPTVANPTPEPSRRVIPIVTVIYDMPERKPYYSPTPGPPTPLPDPTELARLPVSDRLQRIFEGGTGTIIARDIGDAVTPGTGSRPSSWPIIRGYVIEEVPVDPPVTINADNDLFLANGLCIGKVKAPCTVDRLWRITVIGEGFSTDFPMGDLINPSPVSIWVDGKFLGYGWRNGYDAEDGATLLIDDATALREGSILGIGQGRGSVILPSTPTPLPSAPEFFTKPIHFIKTPTP